MINKLAKKDFTLILSILVLCYLFNINSCSIDNENKQGNASKIKDTQYSNIQYEIDSTEVRESKHDDYSKKVFISVDSLGKSKLDITYNERIAESAVFQFQKLQIQEMVELSDFMSKANIAIIDRDNSENPGAFIYLDSVMRLVSLAKIPVFDIGGFYETDGSGARSTISFSSNSDSIVIEHHNNIEGAENKLSDLLGVQLSQRTTLDSTRRNILPLYKLYFEDERRDWDVHLPYKGKGHQFAVHVPTINEAMHILKNTAKSEIHKKAGFTGEGQGFVGISYGFLISKDIKNERLINLLSESILSQKECLLAALDCHSLRPIMLKEDLQNRCIEEIRSCENGSENEEVQNNNNKPCFVGISVSIIIIENDVIFAYICKGKSPRYCRE